MQWEKLWQQILVLRLTEHLLALHYKMSIYFGSTGFIELKRDALNSALGTSLDPADVNTTKKRFSVDNVSGSLITGDQIEIETVDGSNLELLSGHNYPDLRKYIHIDDMGGIKLYNTFASALAGEVTDALTLTAPSSTKNILIRTRNTRFRPLAKITEFEITTTRDTVDVTNLGEEFRQQYENGLISGQGTIQTIWQHRNFQNDTSDFCKSRISCLSKSIIGTDATGSRF